MLSLENLSKLIFINQAIRADISVIIAVISISGLIKEIDCSFPIR